MFGSNSNVNSDLAVHQCNPCNQFTQVDHIQNPSSNSFLNFASQLFDDDALFLSTILPYKPPPPPPPTTANTHIGESSGKQKQPEKGKRKRLTGGPSKVTGSGKQPKRRTGKKDRHSKIHTAHGPRDRRMRLSLQIARKFFDLQDMLGFDKASKTIEWLFNKSKVAIKDLAERSCTSMGASSPLQEINNGGVQMENNVSKGALSQKENRDRARARARERTKEKLMKQKGKMEQNPSSSIRSNLLENARVDQQTMQEQPLEDQMASVAIIEKFLTTSSSIFNFHHENQDRVPSRLVSCDPMMRSSDLGLPDFPGNWVAENARISTRYGLSVSNDMDSTQVVSPNYAQVQGPNGVLIGSPFNLLQGN